MILADVLADYEKQLEAVGEEPEALSFVYRGLKQWGPPAYQRGTGFDYQALGAGERLQPPNGL